jgi:hypothetical protein
MPLPTASLSGISISPRGTHLALWDGALEVRLMISISQAILNSLQYKLYVLALSGRVMATFTPKNDPGLGIRSTAWHPGGTFLALGGWDSKVRSSHLESEHYSELVPQLYLLDNLSWSEVFSMDLQARVSQDVV